MPSPTIADAGNHVVAQILTYRGVVTTGNPWDVTGGGVNATPDTAISATGVTTTVPDTLVVVAFAQGRDASSTSTFSNWINLNLTSVTERADFARNNNDGGGIGVADGIKATAGPTGTTTGEIGNSFVTAFLTIALKPPPPATCDPPANTPAGVTLSCVCDNFTRASLNPSTIFNSNWVVTTSDSTGILPSIVNSGYLRLTNNTGNNAKAATVPGIFPAAGNYISVEFTHYAYNGSGADGIAVTLSDYSVPAVPGAFGGSLGYAQRTGVNGFAGGWIGVALDEYGNYQNPTEGRLGGPGFRVDSVGIRGSGSGMTGYRWLSGTAPLSPGIDQNASATPAPGYTYQVIVDARNEPTSTAVQVNRDTGGGYQSLINVPDVYAAASAQGFTQDAVPANWQISFTGSTGGSTNIHEIGALRICAQTVAPPSGGTATGFNAVDEAYGNPPSVAVQNYLTGHIYMKLVGTAFKLNVAAINNNQILTTYAASGNKNVTVKLVDNSDNACVLDSSQANYCNATCQSKTAVTGGSQTLVFTSSNAGQKQSADFTINTAYRKLVAIISDGTTTACSTDSFAVRPVSISQVISTDATNSGTSGNPKFSAGSDQFTLQATIAGVATYASGYNGVLKINTGKLQAVSPATIVGQLAPTIFGAATPATGSATATGLFTYSEVGAFLLGSASTDTDPRGVYDGIHASECASLSVAQCDVLLSSTWSGVDSVSTAGDCVTNSYSNAKTSGKYGCNFGYTAATAAIGRFHPHHFDTSAQNVCGPSFTYSGQAFPASITARNGGGATTVNYQGALAKNIAFSDGNGATGTFNPQPLLASNFTSGVADLTATPVVSFAYSNPLTAPSTLKLRATDEDGVSSSTGTEGTVDLRSGRLRISNAHGSELLDLPIPLEAQYWNGTMFTANTLDNCTTISPSNIVLTNFQRNLAACETAVSISGSLVAGKANLKMLKPGAGNSGSVDLTVNLGGAVLGSTCLAVGGGTSADVPANMPYLQSRWTGPTYDENPKGRATFGVYKNANEFIYLREMY